MSAEVTFLGLNEVSAVIATAAVAAVVAMWGILSQRAISSRQATLDFIRDGERDHDIVAARKAFNRLARDPAGLGPVAAQPDTDDFKHVIVWLNQFEMVAIGIQRGIFDDEIYRRWYKSGVIRAWKAAAPFIFARRASTNNDALFHEFEEMARYYIGKRPMPRRGFFWGRFL